jgi:hypothetical protein
MTAILLRGTQTSKSPAVSRRGFAIREIATPRSGIEIAVHAKAELPIVGVGNVGHTGRRPITQARTLCHGYVVFHPPVGGFCRGIARERERYRIRHSDAWLLAAAAQYIDVRYPQLPKVL